MSPALPEPHPLACHPDAAAPWIRAVQVGVTVMPDGTLSLTYALNGDLDRIRIPVPDASARADGLWRHTCFEAFVAVDGAAAYAEFNLSPSGQWQAYGFRAYREDRYPLPARHPDVDCRVARGRLLLQACIDPGGLPPGNHLRLGLSAVLEDDRGGFSYWALRHAAGPPDFHHPEAFALSLGRPAVHVLSGIRP